MVPIGVEAVVTGLSLFKSSMGAIDSAITGLLKPSKAVGAIFGWLSGIITSFASGAARTLEYALGNLISSAIQGVIGWFKKLGQEVITSVTEFQKMEVRLNRMNFNDLSDDVKKFSNIMEVVTAVTKEQLRWMGKLAASTPFDAEDIAQTYTLARTYGFTADEAKNLTYEITEFAAGMGLSNKHIERIVQNFGQMKAAGKITGTELRDLARGAFVPVNAVLEKAAENMGITIDQLNKLRKSGLTDAEVFFTAFGGLVEEDFVGAGEDMNAVLAVATNNLRDMLKYMLSMEVVGPIFAGLALKASAFQKAMFNKWDDIETIFSDIGADLNYILDQILGLTPTAETMAEAMVGGLKKISAWLSQNKDGIVEWIKNAADWIDNTLIPSIKDLISFLMDDLVPVFLSLLPLGEAIGGVLMAAFGGTADFTFSEWIQNVLIPAIQDLTKWLTENEEIIGKVIRAFVIAAVVVTVIAGVLSFLGLVIAELGAVIVGVFLVGLAVIVNWAVETYNQIKLWIDNTAFAMEKWAADFVISVQTWSAETVIRITTWASDTWTTFKNWISDIRTSISTGFTNLKTEMELKMKDIARMLLARAQGWINKMVEGFANMADVVIDALNELISNIQMGLKSIVIGISWGSPGKPPSTSAGGGTSGGGGGTGDAMASGTHGGFRIVPPGFNSDNFNLGLTSGERYMVIPRGGQMSSTMAGSTVNRNVNSKVEMNLHINSSAPVESIIQDFGMMSSMIGL